MKPKSALIIGLMFIAITGLLVERLGLYQDGYDIGLSDGVSFLPCVADIQRRVGAKPDGRLGNETQTKWDKMYCEYSAGRYIHKGNMK